MWAALRSDLSEFVSNVAEESSSALNAIDENIGIREIASNVATESSKQDSMLAGTDGDIVVTHEEGEDVDELEEEVNRLRGLEETYLLPLVSVEFEAKWCAKQLSNKAEVNEEIGSNDNDGNIDDGNNEKVTEEENVGVDGEKETVDDPPEQTEENEEQEKEDEEVDIYLSQYEPNEIQQIKEYLQSFQIESHTEEISHLLETHPSLKSHFESLVPTEVGYHPFWMRYYYKCNSDRIQQRWMQDEREDEERRLARNQAIQSGISSVKNLFGGVGTVVRDAVNNTVAPTTVSTGQSTRGGSLLGLGSGGRPPFVLNTAVSDDESDEEELGWDSDEDEDYETDDDEQQQEQEQEESDYEEEVTEDEIIFSPSSPQNKSQIEDERNQLQETIDLQKQEIQHLNKTLKNHPGLSKLESLEMSLFEKDAEIAALKASVEDQNPSSTSSSSTNDDSTEKLSLLQQQLTQTQQSMKTMELHLNSLSQENTSIKEQNQSYLHEIQTLKELVSQLESTNGTLISNTTNSVSVETAANTDPHIEFPKELQRQEQMTPPDFDSLPSSLSSSCVKVAPIPSTNHHEDADEDDPTTLEDRVEDADGTTTSTDTPAVAPTETAIVQDNVTKVEKNQEEEDEEEDDWGDSWGDDEEDI